MITLDLTVHKSVLSFSKHDQHKCMVDIDSYFANDDWCKEAPPYQTWPVLFDRPESHWIELKNQITNQLNTKYNINNFSCIAWAYVCFAGEQQHYFGQNGWHVHNKDNALYSAIFYLNFVNGFDATEFMDSNGDVYRPKMEENMLLCFESKLKHRPATWNHINYKQNRYVVAVDYRKEK